MNYFKYSTYVLLGCLCLLPSPDVYAELSVLTYNIHGGYGPDGEGTPESNLIAFRDNFMNDEDVLCFQEVDDDGDDDCWAVIPNIFTNYPYMYRTINETTKSGSNAETSIAILSKYPFATTDYELIQTDPLYDKWERHAQHVTLQVGDEVVDIFHFHNTYNFDYDDWQYEKSGMVSFRDYVYDELGISSLDEADNLIMLGDFNLYYTNVVTILDTPERKSDGRDHICSIPYFSSEGKYSTVSADLSDHPALWAKIDVQAPDPDPMEWASAPAANGYTGISMEASAASDPYGVEYYFSNVTVTNGSHDSGWQSSPIYVDTGLTDGTTYSYTVMARDKSVNANTTEPSASASAVAVISIQTYASIVYEGFDYTVGSDIAGQGTVIDGWDGAWSAASATSSAQVPHTIATGQNFGSLPVAGGAVHRATRNGDNEISRNVTSASQAALTADNSTIWFSVLMAPRLAGNNSGYAANSCGAIVFGNARFATGTGANSTSAPVINNGGSAVGVGFAGNGSLYTDMRIQGLTYKAGTVTQSKNTAAATLTCGDSVSMIVGKIEWSPNNSLDTLTLYDITDPFAALPAAFCTMQADLDQSTFNVVAIGQGQCELFDEIRIGATAASVGVILEPSDPVVLTIEYTADEVTVGASNLLYAGINYLQSTQQLEDGDSWSNLYSVSGATETNWSISVSNSPAFYRIESVY
jgi:endonuclease/exonuclease/phosphatase family metal-dependent hydrolase